MTKPILKTNQIGQETVVAVERELRTIRLLRAPDKEWSDLRDEYVAAWEEIVDRAGRSAGAEEWELAASMARGQNPQARFDKLMSRDRSR